ncbi:uncharacterized protein LOC122927080 isoform X3 [Bufo gargarizans]|uniref:uncharacterized protein LOC122927080 isoform X3 n=1 Tax=Bufo gargarizans TaxID=30331 RepID=UPI001CF4CC1F|nr:uncharacterized protein LOC122927080 isoform X3 [Bufo gargarizans]
MGLTLMEVLVRALKKLEDLSFQRFIEKLSVWEVREEYKEIPNDELTGKEPEKVAGLINTYYRYAYGAELTMAVLEDIDEKKVREELQQDLRIVDIPGHGLGTAMFTDKVNFIDNHRSELIRRMTDVDPVLNDLQDQGLLTREQYNDVMENITLEEKMEDLCAIIRHLEDTEKYTAYTVLEEHNERLVKGLETEDTKWGDLWPCVTEEEGKQHQKPPNPILRMGLTLQEVLIRTLKKLEESSFQRFIKNLSVWEAREEYEYENIPKNELTGKNPEHIAGLINTYYKYAYGAEVTLAILEDIDEKKVREELQQELKEVDILRQGLGTRMFTDRVNFICYDRLDLDLMMALIDTNSVLHDLRDQDLLTQDQFNDVVEKETWNDLYDIIRTWEDTEKYMAHTVLKKYSSGVHHFLVRHTNDLICIIKEVNPVVEDLRSNHLLAENQYADLQAMTTPAEQMRLLCAIVQHQLDKVKDQFYISLWRYNYTAITDFEKSKPWSSTVFSNDLQDGTGSSELFYSAGDPARNKKELTQDMHYIPPVMGASLTLGEPGIWSGSHSKRSTFARNDNLKYKEAREYVQSETQNCSPDDDYLDFGGRDAQSETQNCSPDDDYLDFGGRDTQSDPHENYDLFRNEDSDFALNPYQKERKHFVDEHCWDLIRRIIMVDPVLDDLQEQNLVTQEQYDALMKLKTPQKKMIDLYDIVRFWTNLKKDQVYLALRQHNPAFIRVLEKSDQMLKSRNRNKGSYYMKLTLDLETGSSAGEHFLDKNKSGLINVMSTADPVVEDLREEGLLTEEQYHNILLKETSKEKMAEIYNITDSFDNVKKDKVYLALRTHNRSHIRVMERISNPSLSVSENSGDAVKYIDLGPEEKDNHTVWKVPGSIIFTIICCICKEMYKTPVTLICGHNYCLECIDKTWNNQDSDDTSCPICRRRFKNRPELNKNLVLCQIAEFCQSSKSDKKTHEYCTYCTSPLPRRAVKQCLLCDAFLCEDHLKVHSKQAEHVLLDPSVSPKNRKCSIHKTVLEYYCSQDSACVCSHCCIVGEHKGHQVIPIGEAMEMKKDKLRDTEENLKLKKSEIEKSIKICLLKVQEKAHTASETVEVEEMREILELVQGGLFIEEGQAEYLVEDLIRQLEAKRSHLTQCIAHIEELCYDTDPFLVLQDQEDYNL